MLKEICAARGGFLHADLEIMHVLGLGAECYAERDGAAGCGCPYNAEKLCMCCD
jgi:hypothetical protein